MHVLRRIGAGTTWLVLLVAIATPLAAQEVGEAARIVLHAGAPFDGPIVLTHPGVGTPPERADGAQRAAEAALQALRAGRSALDAAVAGTVVMEDDPRYNAGTGANIRLDGRTIQMDAALMTGKGRFAAVAVIERVRNPIRVVHKVLDTPHLLLAGEGATRFAHRMGFADVIPTCAEAEEKYRRRVARVREALAQGADEFDWPAHWNFPNPLPETLRDLAEGGDTVGTVVRAADGTFAATLSTGGTSITLHGRVGDVPIFGAGLYAGAHGAVACTGHGEEIIRHAMARQVYERIATGSAAARAVREAAESFPSESSLGVIALDRHGWGVVANRQMGYGLAGPAPVEGQE
ncbi:MAG: isoaspartyl peptidase/L-asparaginase [Candidatus Latescibacterota bacterium]|nr:MAG: isoaspartyl peptidase/L-asparaginase [Candidatus Latescibacterota bacterium]